MKKNVIIAVVSLVAGLVIGFFVGRCCVCQKICAAEQVPDTQEIKQLVEKEVAEQLGSADSVEVHSVRVVTTTPENLSKTLDEKIGKALKEAKNLQAEQ
ncbi:MAG: hypothetical protein IKQ94_06685 [Bacteroidales bacterium]|nr:hypothetical protein [Bacteroidales bacterium]